jgi:hypothetical protein
MEQASLPVMRFKGEVTTDKRGVNNQKDVLVKI